MRRIQTEQQILITAAGMLNQFPLGVNHSCFGFHQPAQLYAYLALNESQNLKNDPTFYKHEED
jgi:hypothetical protein